MFACLFCLCAALCLQSDAAVRLISVADSCSVFCLSLLIPLFLLVLLLPSFWLGLLSGVSWGKACSLSLTFLCLCVRACTPVQLVHVLVSLSCPAHHSITPPTLLTPPPSMASTAAEVLIKRPVLPAARSHHPRRSHNHRRCHLLCLHCVTAFPSQACVSAITFLQ